MSHPPQIIILAGPNGAGKTTLAPFLLRDRLHVFEYVNADTIAAGLSAFQPEGAALAAGRVMLQRLRELAAQRVPFAFETTLATRSYAGWLRKLCAQGYDLSLIYLWLRTPETGIKRVQDRVRLGGHDIPEEVVRRRYHKGVQNFFAIYQEIAANWVVYDHTVSNAPQLVAAGRGKTELNVNNQEVWIKFCEAEQ